MAKVTKFKLVDFEFSKECMFLLITGRYPGVNKDYVNKYLDFCISHNLDPHAYRYRAPKGRHPDTRYHHVMPVSLFPELTAKLVVLSKIDHCDAHKLLCYAFSSYYQSSDPKKAQIFFNLSRAVGCCISQLPKRIRQCHSDEYSQEFFKLTGKSLCCKDMKQRHRDYQQVRRSTPLGKAYDNLKGYLRFLEKKYDINYTKVINIPSRATTLVSTCLYFPGSNEERDKLATLLKTYNEVHSTNSVSLVV